MDYFLAGEDQQLLLNKPTSLTNWLAVNPQLVNLGGIYLRLGHH